MNRDVFEAIIRILEAPIEYEPNILHGEFFPQQTLKVWDGSMWREFREFIVSIEDATTTINQIKENFRIRPESVKTDGEFIINYLNTITEKIQTGTVRRRECVQEIRYLKEYYEGMIEMAEQFKQRAMNPNEIYDIRTPQGIEERLRCGIWPRPNGGFVPTITGAITEPADARAELLTEYAVPDTPWESIMMADE